MNIISHHMFITDYVNICVREFVHRRITERLSKIARDMINLVYNLAYVGAKNL